MERYFSVGSLLIFDKGQLVENPYKQSGLSGDDRKKALEALKEGIYGFAGYDLWYAPSEGGARHLYYKAHKLIFIGDRIHLIESNFLVRTMIEVKHKDKPVVPPGTLGRFERHPLASSKRAIVSFPSIGDTLYNLEINSEVEFV